MRTLRQQQRKTERDANRRHDRALAARKAAEREAEGETPQERDISDILEGPHGAQPRVHEVM